MTLGVGIAVGIKRDWRGHMNLMCARGKEMYVVTEELKKEMLCYCCLASDGDNNVLEEGASDRDGVEHHVAAPQQG